MGKWLSVVGIGEDGWLGVNPVGRSLLEGAQVIYGGKRHLDLLPPYLEQERILWRFPIEQSLEEIVQRQGQKVAVLASGDPMCYGIGVTLSRQIPMSEMIIVPTVSAFSLACARLGWSLTEVETLSLCGRDPHLIKACLYPGAKILVLSSDRHTPSQVAQILCEQGWGATQMTVLEHLGGNRERMVTGIAQSWENPELADLNTLALLCRLEHPAPYPGRSFGLPDTAFHHDGQLTKKEIRTLTLGALTPSPGQTLWDVGAGCGSISIEWMRFHPRCLAVAIEQHPERLEYIAANAIALGVPNLKIVRGTAPAVLKDLPSPHAIFIGGGITQPHLLEVCWEALPLGGKLVVNAVTVESEQQLFYWQGKLGGELSRMAIQRAQPLGKFLGWKAMAPVTQWVVIKD
jgi:precorrin-6Y C5,15-methyltransferase (decarboxylating)